MNFIHNVKIGSIKKTKIKNFLDVIVECNLIITSYEELHPNVTQRGILKIKFEIDSRLLEYNFTSFEQLNEDIVINWVLENDNARLNYFKNRQEQIIISKINLPEKDYEIICLPWE